MTFLRSLLLCRTVNHRLLSRPGLDTQNVIKAHYVEKKGRNVIVLKLDFVQLLAYLTNLWGEGMMIEAATERKVGRHV